MLVGQLRERLIQAHDVASQFEAFRAERSSHQAEGGISLRLGHLFETDSLTHVEMLIHPLAPLRVINREHGSSQLHAGERSDESFGSIADGFGGNAARADLK